MVFDHPAKKSGCAFPKSSDGPEKRGIPLASVSPVRTLPYRSPILPPTVADTFMLPSLDSLYTKVSSPSTNSSTLLSLLE